jgi:predicted nuclease with TOPRIM domain
MENERIQKAAAEAIDLKTKYDKLHQQHHALNHELKKKNEEITKLQNRISELELKTQELSDYEILKQNSVELQLHNVDLMAELE